MDTILQILISAVDEASETLAGISASLSDMAAGAEESSAATAESFDAMTSSVAGSVSAMDASLAEFGLQINTTTGEIDSALLTQEQAFALCSEMVQADTQEMIDLIQEEGITAQEAAAVIAEADAEIGAANEEAASTSAGAYAGMAAVAGIAFLAIKNSIGDAITSAQKWDESSAGIVQILKDTGSSIPLTQIQAYAQQLQLTTLFTQQSTLTAEAEILSHKNLQESYETLTDLSADLATKMGSDIPNAAKILTNALADPVAGLNQIIRQGNINFPATAVTMIENMAKVGDTAGADALLLKTLTNSIGGMAQAAGGAQGAAITQLGNQMTALGTVIGNDLLPMLDTIATDLMPVIQEISAWAQEHPLLTDAIVIGSVALAGLLLLIGLIGVAIITFTPVVELLTVVLGGLSLAAALPLLPFIAFGAALVVLATLIITNWDALKNDMEAIGQIISANWDATWNGISTFGRNILNIIKDMVHSVITDISTDWNNVWTGISTFFTNIWNTIINDLKSDINSAISLINGLISSVDALHISIPAITIPGTKIGTPAVNIGFNIPTIPALATGGIVSVPTVALIGEGGPEAVVPLSSSGIASFSGNGAGGSQQQIVINIQGGYYLDQQAAKQIGDTLAKQIVQQIRVKNYAF